MRIDESWGYNLIFAVDDGDNFGSIDILADLGDTTTLDQDIVISENNNVVVLIMLKNSAILEK